MPEVRALRSFKGRYGPIRTGQRFNCEPGYLSQLLKNKLVALIEPGPSKDRSIPEAPGKAGKDQGGKEATNPGSRTRSGQGAGSGKALTSVSLPAGRASRKKTVMQSGTGGRRGTPTPRTKAKTKTSGTTDPAADGE